MVTMKDYLKIDCYSFTVLILINAVLVWTGIIEDMNISVSIQLFIITSTIAFLMFLTDWLWNRKGEGIKRIFHIMDILISVWLWGVVFENISFSYKDSIITAMVCICTYLCVSGIMVLENKRDADDINNSIKKMRLRNKS